VAGISCKTTRPCAGTTSFSKVIDESVDLSNLSLGREGTDTQYTQEREALLAAFMGPKVRPDGPVVDAGRKHLPLVMRWHAWHGPVYRPVHDKLNRAMRAVLLFARTDSKIMPLNRYRSSREAVSAVLSMYKQHALVCAHCEGAAAGC
jgi:hypothetical protein